MAGKLTFKLEQYQEAATIYREDLLKLPIIGCKSTIQYMTERPGVRLKEVVGELVGDAQFAPHKSGRSVNFDLELKHRVLKTEFGSVVAKFDPTSAISTLLGKGATTGDGLMQTPTALEVLALIAKKLSKHLNDAIWSGKYNPDGTTTADLFDGFDTITEQEIAAGEISQANKNLLVLDEEITAANAVDVAKKILRSMSPELREEECYLYCDQEFVDFYNEGYMLTHGGLVYNQAYSQQAVEGSNGKLIFCPLANKAGSKFLHVSLKENMLVGYDQMGDEEDVTVEKHEAFILDYIATMFFGVQFESIDPRRLLVVQKAA